MLASFMVSLASMAQWTKPAMQAQPMETDKECYLFNVGAEGFLVGANDYGTRASVGATLGHKVKIEQGTAEGSYYITNYVLAGWMANQWGYMFIEPNGLDNVYVDNTKDGKKDNQFTITDKGDHVYQIGLSPQNENWTDEMQALFGVIPERQDTRLYFAHPAGQDYVFENCLTDWIFVTTEAYEAYVPMRQQYDAAMQLGATLEEAKTTEGTSAEAITAAQAVYDNTGSTREELDKARTDLYEAIKLARFNLASVQNPVEVLSLLGIATDFSNGPAGWTSTTGAQNKGADNGNNAADYGVTGNHYENWNPSAFTPGKISATPQGLPVGVYHLNALAFSNTGDGAYLYAGDSRTAVTATQIDVEQAFDCYSVSADGTLEIGLDIPERGPNWVGLDNVYLYYLGNSQDAYDELRKQITADLPEYDVMDEIAYNKAAMEAYTLALQTLNEAGTPEACVKALKDFTEAHEALKLSIAAYTKYLQKVNEAKDWLQGCTGEGEEIDLLASYLSDGLTEGFNGNGSADYILEMGTLDNEQITAETAYLNTLLGAAQKNQMKDGDDCTAMLVNPDFSAEGGWTSAAGINWPVGKTSEFPVFEAWGRVCDVYQQLGGLQNGLYELSLQAVYRPDNDADIRQTYAYINDFDTKIGITSEENPANSADEASSAFANGLYPVKAYGLVTDGQMRLGIANRLRTGENGILWAGGVKLIFRAKNAEALQAMFDYLLPLAQKKLENACSTEELGALTTAIENVEYAEDNNERYTALVALKKAMDAVDAATEVYARLLAVTVDLYDIINGNSDVKLPENADAATIKAASDFLEEAKSSYENRTYTTEEAEKAIETISSYKVALMMGQGIASEENPVDYSSAIVNNNFDPAKGNKDEKRIDGWNVEGALNGYKQNTCSFNKGTFRLSQELTGLPAGKYKVTVHTFYRAGSYEEEEANINAGKDTHLMKLFANEEEKAVMNLSEGSQGVTLPEGISTKTINGITVPDGTSSSVACFNAGLFLNELEFTVGEDGKATIGLKLEETIGTNDYTVVGEWKLWYMGNPVADLTEQDVTSLIVNNNFDPAKGNKDEKRIDGWNVEGALNGYKQNTCSFNKGTFRLSQELTGLPAGNYKVTVHTFYRAGSYEEEEANINAGKDTHLMKLFANEEEKPVMNLSEGSQGVTLPEGISTKTINGITVPDGTSASVACFNAGLFLNELEFTVGEDGKATIGLKLEETIGTNDYTVVGEWKLWYMGNPVADLTEQDVTSLIVNNTFDPAKGNKDEKRIDGWNVEGALNGYKKYTCSFNKGTFDLNQKLTGLPEGTYKVTVHTFYRAGSYEEEEANINAGKDTHLMKFYANTADKEYMKAIMNLSEGAKDITAMPEGINTRVINGITVPDGTDASIACFNAGYYLNELPFYVGQDGEVTIGLKLEETIGTNDYTVVGAWHLFYYGNGNHLEDIDTAVEDVEESPVELVPVAYYNLNGTRTSGLQRGINLVKMSNGKTIKVMVK